MGRMERNAPEPRSMSNGQSFSNGNGGGADREVDWYAGHLLGGRCHWWLWA